MKICFLYFSVLMLVSVMFFIGGMFSLIIDLVYMIEMEILQINSSKFLMVMVLDWMSLLFISFVMYISSMVIYYSQGYMKNELNINRFIVLVVLFVLSMILMIISPNLISILLGWDGLGLVSYCLVIFYQNTKSYVAGMLTILMNRIGDIALLFSVSWMLNYGSWNFMFYLDFMKKNQFMQIILILVVLASLTKSAQIPFSSWLPAAMAAPTPVSSLVHSSTLVTAGVYLLIRFNYALSWNLSYMLLFISLMTMFMAGLGANYEIDLKKIIALSTLSQLGFMLSILSIGEYKLSFFHLLTHALFKATLFMCAGCMIHTLMNNQDIRVMGGLIKFMPVTISIFNISNLSLCGFPFLAGFYSKDLILEFISMSHMNLYVYMLYFFSTGLTVSYSIRLFYYTVISNYSGTSLNMLQESDYNMLKGMIGLFIWVVFMGSSLNWLMFFTPYFICLPKLMKMMTLLVIIMGSWLGLEISNFYILIQLKALKWLKLSLFFSKMWNLPILSVFMFNYFFLNSGKIIYMKIDNGWAEYLSTKIISKMMVVKSSFVQFILYSNFKIILMLIIMHLMILFIFF